MPAPRCRSACRKDGRHEVMHRFAPAIWMGSAFSAAAAVAAVVLWACGLNYHGVSVAVTSSARVAFLFFWLAYAGGALARLCGPNLARFSGLSREFGLAFVAALSVHLLLVAVLFRISSRPPMGNAGILYFGIGASWTYAIALCSIELIRGGLRPAIWRAMSSIGIEYIELLFVLDFVVHPIRNGFSHPLEYAPFSALVIIGPLLRWTVAVKRWRTSRIPA
jgi:hypothetical protein